MGSDMRVNGRMVESSQRKRPVDRRAVLAAAGTLNALVGAIYVWSIISIALADEYGWSPQGIAFAYSLYIVCECCSGFLAGYLQTRMDSRFLTLCGGVCLASGWFLAGFADAVPLLYLTFSMLGGIGSGFVYNVSVSTATAWFPDKRGLANGVCVGCLGLSPIVFAPLGSFLIGSFGSSFTFHACGAFFAVAAVTASRFLHKAPDSKPVPEQAYRDALESGMTTARMLRQPSAYLMWLLFAVSASAGMMVTGHAAGIGAELAGLTAAQNAAQVSILALANFSGRLAFGMLSDRFGRYPVLAFCMATTALTMAFFLGNAHDFATLTAAFCIIGATFGGCMAVMPALTADLFGIEHFGQNYAFMFSGYTCASVIGPMLGASVLAATGSYLPAFPAASALTCAGIALTAATAYAGKRMRRSRTTDES
ncbi:MAG: OFA family MFS transporter [Slackia sp.]|nr:OFA family MFS transporter [Slackia sp.]